MKIIKKYDEYLNEGFNMNNVQFLYKRVLNSLGVKLYYASKYEIAIIALLPIVDNLVNAEGYIFEKKNDNIILITLYTISILTHESIDKINKIYEIIKSRDITDTEVQYLINSLNNLRYIFSIIAKTRKVDSFYDMLRETDYLIPFLHVINNMILNKRLNINILTGKIDDIKEYLGEKRFELLIHNILNKMNIVLGSGNKIQNKDVLKQLLINDEFKGPMYNTGKVDFGENITEGILDKLKGPSYEDVLKNKTSDELLKFCFNNLDDVGVKYALEHGASEELYDKLTEMKKWFLSLITDLEMFKKENYSDSVFWKKDGVILFRQDLKSKLLMVSDDNIWSVFENKYDYEYDDIQSFIKNLVEEYLNWNGFTPMWILD